MAVRQRQTDKEDSALSEENHRDQSEIKIARPDHPCHTPRESLFSSGSGFHNYRGLLNNCILLLVLSNAKNVITNLGKYGILVNPLQIGSRASHIHWSLLFVFLISYIIPVIILLVEKQAAKGRVSNKGMGIFHGCFFSAILILPACYSYWVDAGPAYSFAALGWYTIIWLKLVSYAQVNWWCRNSCHSPGKPPETDPSKPSLVQYPDNLTLKDMVYFILAPTLCYELNFPRNSKRRPIFILRRLLEVIFILNVNMAIFQQWIIPTALNSLQPFRDMDWAKMVERVLLLALPNHLFWLLCFYMLFHSFLNLMGELLCFADREFYEDWWNATTIGRFWRTWNMPVHRWAYRHVYNPVTKMGWSRLMAQLTVFSVSAFFHEYLVSFPLQMIRPWAFVGMVSQIPLGIITALPFARGQIGNFIVWISIVLGQPVAILMYLHDYYWIHWSSNTTPNASTIKIS